MGIETLQAWQLGMDLVDRVYELTANFPREEMYVLTAQIRRAALSIPSNLAEGRARGSRRDYRRFVAYAQGSTAEVWTQLRIAERRGYVSDSSHVTELLDHISRKLTNLRRSLLMAREPRTPNPELRIPQQ